MQRAQRCYNTIQLLFILVSIIRAAAAQQGAVIGSNSTPPAAAAPTRFFIDEGFFLEGDTEILRAHISASAGRLAISGESSAAFLSVKGYYSPETWDVYWTIRSACHMAYKHMGPHQLVNCIPGVAAVSLKRNFVSTWQQAYGEQAYDFIPRSYLIPEQYWVWRNHLLASGSPQDRKWVLKANIHRGKGVSVVSQHEALREALTHSKERGTTGASSSSSSSSEVHYLNVLVQSYLQQQLVIGGRSSYIRVWLLVTSINPLRAYLFHGGFAIFGKQKAGAAGAAEGTAAAADSRNKTVGAGAGSHSSRKDDLIVNLWIQDRDSSPIWSLQRLEQYLAAHPDTVLPLPDTRQQPGKRQLLLQANDSSSGSSNRNSSGAGGGPRQQKRRRRTFADAWSDMRTSASLVLAAALPTMRAAADSTGAPASGTFEYFGLDFVLDAHLRPWMLEVNAIPSLSRRKKSECTGVRATADCKLTTTNSNSSSKGAGGSDKSAAASVAGAAVNDFDAQKELFVHDMLMLLGLPVDPNSNKSTAAAGSMSDAAGVLRMAAAAAAAAGIRSPAGAPVAATKATTKTGSSSNVADRHLLLQGQAHNIRQQQQQQQQQRQQQQQQQRPLWRQLQQHVRHVRQHVRPHPHHRANHPATAERPQRSSRSNDSSNISRSGSSSASSSGNSSGSSGNSSSTSRAHQWYKGVVGLQWPYPVPGLKQLPAQIQKLLCPANSSSSSGTGGEFACVSCLTAEDLAAIAAAEAELQRAGNLVPVHDLIPAHVINTQALKKASGPAGTNSTTPSATATAATAAGGTSSEERQPTAAAGAASAAADTPASAAAAAGEVDAAAAGELYLSENPSVWQKLHRAWLGMSRGQVGLRDLAVMQHYTTRATVSAEKAVGLQRVDYVMSAWLRVRQQERCTGEGVSAADCVGKRLGLLVSNCFLQ